LSRTRNACRTRPAGSLAGKSIVIRMRSDDRLSIVVRSRLASLACSFTHVFPRAAPPATGRPCSVGDNLATTNGLVGDNLATTKCSVGDNLATTWRQARLRPRPSICCRTPHNCCRRRQSRTAELWRKSPQTRRRVRTVVKT
jgi:hypothetical protein